MKKLKVAVFIQIILLISVLSSCQTIDKKMSISSFDKDCKEIKETYNFESSDSLKFVFLNCLILYTIMELKHVLIQPQTLKLKYIIKLKKLY